MFDNEALYDYHHCWRENGSSNSPSFAELNGIMADYLTTLTHPMRFDEGPLALSLRDLVTNAVPQVRAPRLGLDCLPGSRHYVLPALAVDPGGADPSAQLSELQLIMRTWEPSSFLVKTEPRSANRYCDVVTYTSAAPSVPHVLDAVRCVQASEQLAHTGHHYNCASLKMSKLAVSNCSSSEEAVGSVRSRSALLLNCGAAGEVLGRRLHQFDQMYSRRSHVHRGIRLRI